MSALIARLAPYSMLALAIAGVVIWGLIERNAATCQCQGGPAARPEASGHRNQSRHRHGEGLCGTGHARLRSVSCHARCF